MVQQPTETFEERLSKERLKIKEAADKLTAGRARGRFQHTETASNIEKWLSAKICANAC